MATLQQLENQHMAAAEAQWDRECEKQDKRQATIDELVSDQWNTLTSVEDEIAEQADVLAPLIMKCEQGAISNEELGEMILSELSRFFKNNAERLLD